MSKERDIAKWNKVIDRAVKELRALGVEPVISPSPRMISMEAYKEFLRKLIVDGNYRRATPEEEAEEMLLTQAMMEAGVPISESMRAARDLIAKGV